MVKLIRNSDGAQVEKSESNWANLPKDRKDQYTVVTDGVTIPDKLKRFSPPELNPKSEKVETTTPAVPAAPANPEPKAEIPNPDETQDEKIIRLFKAASPADDEAKKTTISAIAKEVAAHFKSVEKVVNNYLKSNS